MAKDRKTEHRRKKGIKLTVDVCLPLACSSRSRRPLCRLSVSMTPSDAFFIIHSIIRRCAWQALLHIYIYQPKRVEPDKRVPDNPSRTYVNILNNALLHTHTHTHGQARARVRIRIKRVRTYVHWQVGKKKKINAPHTRRIYIYIYKIHVYIVATLHAQKSYPP